MCDAELAGNRGAVAVVTVEELQHGDRSAEGCDALLCRIEADRIDEPHAASVGERM
jgi:hypothetical protein